MELSEVLPLMKSPVDWSHLGSQPHNSCSEEVKEKKLDKEEPNFGLQKAQSRDSTESLQDMGQSLDRVLRPKQQTSTLDGKCFQVTYWCHYYFQGMTLVVQKCILNCLGYLEQYALNFHQ